MLKGFPLHRIIVCMSPWPDVIPPGILYNKTFQILNNLLFSKIVNTTCSFLLYWKPSDTVYPSTQDVQTPHYLCQRYRNSTLRVCVLTSYIEIDRPLIFAHFVFSRAHVHDRNAGVPYLKPAHCLLGEKMRMRLKIIVQSWKGSAVYCTVAEQTGHHSGATE